MNIKTDVIDIDIDIDNDLGIDKNLAKVVSATLVGIEALTIIVEVDAGRGLPTETIVGLPDTVVKESRNRIKSAIKNSGFEYQLKNYTINLAPAEIRKEGPLLDLALAVGILHSTRQLPPDPDAVFVGELSLDGELNSIRGILSICHSFIKKNENTKIFIPYENLEEVSLLPKCNVVPLKKLADLVDYYKGVYTYEKPEKKAIANISSGLDFCEVKGQELAKRALEIASAGNHNILLIGPPGSGKSMLLKRLPTILPKMSLDEALETMKIYSLITHANNQSIDLGFIRPFRAPHHSISYAGMVGGGPYPKPGEISLAHNGVLFLDELPEFQRNVLEVLRQPLEDKQILISRAHTSVRYPADFMLVSAMNPCPCGYYNDRLTKCKCPDKAVKKYWKKLSGPIMDRIDIIIEVPRLKKNEYFENSKPIDHYFSSKEMEIRVVKARRLQERRFEKEKTNSNMTNLEIEAHCQITQDIRQFLETAIDKGMMTARSFHRILKVARTIADLEDSMEVSLEHVAEALQYRSALLSM